MLNFKYPRLLVIEMQENKKIVIWEFVNIPVNIQCLTVKDCKELIWLSIVT